jgi:CPA2 family monovalent cation:H+ antiporter-2
VLLIAKPFFVTIGGLLSGLPLKTALQTGMSLSQIGEFSFIIASLGLTLQVTSDYLYPVAVAVSVLTAFTTPYMIRFSAKVSELVERKLPPKVLSSLNRYSADMNSIKYISEWRKLIRRYVSIIIVNSILVIGITVLSRKVLLPQLQKLTGEELWSTVLTAVCTLLAISPFILSITIRKIVPPGNSRGWLNRKNNRLPLIFMEIIRMCTAVFLIGFLFNYLFSSIVAFIAAVAATFVIVIVFARHLHIFYGMIEQRFMRNLSNRRDAAPISDAESLAPWDAHMAEYEINPGTPFLGLTLQEARFRETFGINVVRIIRGETWINIPDKNTKLFPFDKITVIGTDEQLTHFKKALHDSKDDQPVPVEEVRMQQFVVGNNSQLLGRNIRSSQIREKTKGLIIGIERNGERILNPDSSLEFMPGDVVWLVTVGNFDPVALA